MKKSEFLSTLNGAIKSGNVNTLLLDIETPANKNEVTIVQGEDEVGKKLEYINSAYDESMRLKRNDAVKILDYTFGYIDRVGLAAITHALFRMEGDIETLEALEEE